MDLLDLPPEIFQHIIHELVKNIGIPETWSEYREVCRAFANEVKDDILLRQPRETYENAQAISEERVPLFQDCEFLELLLYHRAQNVLGFHPTLPQKVLNLADFLFEAPVSDHYGARKNHDDCVREVCKTIVDAGYDDLIFDDLVICPLYADRYDFVDQLALATRLQDSGLARSVLSQWSAPVYEDNIMFGNPLKNAVCAGDHRLIEDILEHLENDPDQYKTGNINPSFTLQLFSDMISDANHASMQLLLDWYIKHVDIPPKPYYNTWLKGAVRNKDLDSINYLLGVKIRYHPRITFSTFEVACCFGDVHILAALMGKGRIQPHKIYRISSALTAAVASGNMDSVQTVLHAGANPDGPTFSNKGAVTPLQKAIDKNNIKMVNLLIEKGATVKQVRFPELEMPQTCTAWVGKKEIYKLLRPLGIAQGAGVDIPTLGEVKRAYRKWKTTQA
ncbi:hypothetical protein BDV96DRAFT_599444 [Lophiotrema nucula]|uniref:Uncharacterized protein n=1 Tax=Lophiotrema nucula TaxID=690887 RepID=A0A6A5Z8P4_9PLEO|nr:hypothetical protein BDV96DRAFT_599444 [Lophiotrema nucula]